MKIGNVNLKNRIILAPMAGVTDLPFRLLCKENGAGMVCTEMVSAKAISFHNKNTEALLEISPEEHPVSLQLFGSDPDIISEMAAYIEERPFDILDLNMGCPVPKVAGNGKRASMLWKLQGLRKLPERLRLRFMQEQGNSIIPERLTGISSDRSRKQCASR